MKKCTYCGAEYPDQSTRCMIDNQWLPDSEPSAPLPDEAEIRPSSSPKAFTEWEMRFIELLLVCLIAFGTSVLSSLHAVSSYYPDAAGSPGNYRWFYSLSREASCLWLLWYVLRRSGRTVRDLGMVWARTDVPWSILIRLIAFGAFEAVYHSVLALGNAGVIAAPASVNVNRHLFGDSVALLAFVFQLVNPFFEELIVRAYVMTEVKYLTNSWGKAIFVSTALQSIYHLYQGVPSALGHAAGFLVFSIYYAKTRRITPLILAHVYMDVMATAVYALHHPG
jgi:membrane protease YdiL (CAAX protease family)